MGIENLEKTDAAQEELRRKGLHLASSRTKPGDSRP
jgi:hypothetical protein